MIDEEFKNIIEEESRVGEFIYPSYEKYCFSNIPSTILKFFNIKTRRPSLPPKIYRNRVEYEDSKKIILLLIDGYGYNQWLECHKKYKFLKEISQNGVISPITTVFPSTTAAALTTINTGLTPQEHALPEWHIYFEEIDMIINTLPFTPLGDKGQDRLLEMGVNPKILYNGNTIYQTLKNESVKSYTFIKASYAHSCYSKIVHEGSTIVPFITYSDMFTKLRKIVKEEKGPAYFYCLSRQLGCYWTSIRSSHNGIFRRTISAFLFNKNRTLGKDRQERNKANTSLDNFGSRSSGHFARGHNLSKRIPEANTCLEEKQERKTNSTNRKRSRRFLTHRTYQARGNVQLLVKETTEKSEGHEND